MLPQDRNKKHVTGTLTRVFERDHNKQSTTNRAKGPYIVNASILLLLLNRRRQRRQRRDRRWYVRPLNTTRDQDGEFVSLVLPMRSLDEERHFQYFRMSAPKFDDLVSRVIPYLPDSHQNHRNPIGASQRLAVTLRYLATGIGLQALSNIYISI